MVLKKKGGNWHRKKKEDTEGRLSPGSGVGDFLQQDFLGGGRVHLLPVIESAPLFDKRGKRGGNAQFKVVMRNSPCSVGAGLTRLVLD